MPGGSVAIAGARKKVESFVWGRGWCEANFVPPSLVHCDRVELPLATDAVYIGMGSFLAQLVRVSASRNG